MRSLRQILLSVGTGKGYKESFVSQIKGRNSTAVTVLKIFQAAPDPGDSVSYKGAAGGAMASSAFLILEEGNEGQLRRVCAYLWQNFKVLTCPIDFLFLKQSRDKAYGIQGMERRIQPYRPRDK